ncbi:MAG: DUF1156 domain-containing protein [Planctomycetota bacterium]|nr:DUF1156 domain-containing protein [Planctomycetota bacterium]
MTKPYRKKLIEVALPLVAINAEAAREKSIRHGHPSTLHCRRRGPRAGRAKQAQPQFISAVIGHGHDLSVCQP